MQAWLKLGGLVHGWSQDVDTDFLAEEQQPKRMRSPGTAWVEVRGRPIAGSLEIRGCNGMTPVTYEATFQVEVATGARVGLMLDYDDRAELERQCQVIFAAGDVVVSGGLVLLEDGPLVIGTKWEPVISLG